MEKLKKKARQKLSWLRAIHEITQVEMKLICIYVRKPRVRLRQPVRCWGGLTLFHDVYSSTALTVTLIEIKKEIIFIS